MRILMICAVLTLCGCASLPPQPAAAPPTAANRSPCAVAGSSMSRIEKDCMTTRGSIYTQQDILNTGEPYVGAALRTLDPTITVQH
jgi:hypothetical protein